MKSRVASFIFILIIWSLLNWPIDIDHIVAGTIVSIIVSLLVGDLFVTSISGFFQGKRYLWFLYYIFIFSWECIKANCDVAYRVLHPQLPINPGIVKVKTILKTDIALTFLANSITLTPGTICLDIDKENGFLYIHWINVKSNDKSNEIILDRVTKYEKILKNICE